MTSLDTYSDSDTDTASLLSLESDDSVHRPEAILAELAHKGHIWYLVQWLDCPVLNSSWEGPDILVQHPDLQKQWEEEKERQRKGESKALDIAAFEKECVDVFEKEAERRILRRLKRKVERLLLAVAE